MLVLRCRRRPSTACRGAVPQPACTLLPSIAPNAVEGLQQPASKHGRHPANGPTWRLLSPALTSCPASSVLGSTAQPRTPSSAAASAGAGPAASKGNSTASMRVITALQACTSLCSSGSREGAREGREGHSWVAGEEHGVARCGTVPGTVWQGCQGGAATLPGWVRSWEGGRHSDLWMLSASREGAGRCCPTLTTVAVLKGPEIANPVRPPRQVTSAGSAKREAAWGGR